MGHLNAEILARLVDEPPQPDEAEHLATCLVCASELEAMRAQVRALGSLPEIRPPLGDWEVLEARLRSEGLIEVPSLLSRLTLAHTPAWMRAAAAAALFMGGTLVGAGAASRAGLRPGMPGAADGGPALFASADNLDDAAAAVRMAEQGYVSAVTRYRELMDQGGGSDGMVQGDPRSRFAALEYLVAASQAAVRQAPADPFLNGLLVTTRAERDATLRRISTSKDNWF